MRVQHHQPGHARKVLPIAGEQRQPMRPRRGGNDGIGQLHAVLLPQADGLRDDGFVEGQHFHTLYEGLEECRFWSWHKFAQQFDARDYGDDNLMRGQLCIKPSCTGHWKPPQHQVDDDVGIG